MDLIYADDRHRELGVLRGYQLDLSFGAKENDFQLKLDASAHCCRAGYLLYIEGTEYGGVVDSISSDTGTGEVTYMGRTWHGLLNSKVLEPDFAEDYLTVSGEANAVLRRLVDRLQQGELFRVSGEDSGIQVQAYRFDRYCKAYDGIRAMLRASGGKLQIRMHRGVVQLSAVPRGDYTASGELDSDLLPMQVCRQYEPVNHLICLGKGELHLRQVLHLYADAGGTISTSQSLTGARERTEVYDYPNAESADELQQHGRQRLQELRSTDTVKLNLAVQADRFTVGDLVGAVDHVSGLSAQAEITQKIVKADAGAITISYELGGT